MWRYYLGAEEIAALFDTSGRRAHVGEEKPGLEDRNISRGWEWCSSALSWWAPQKISLTSAAPPGTRRFCCSSYMWWKHSENTVCPATNTTVPLIPWWSLIRVIDHSRQSPPTSHKSLIHPGESACHWWQIIRSRGVVTLLTSNMGHIQRAGPVTGFHQSSAQSGFLLIPEWVQKYRFSVCGKIRSFFPPSLESSTS